MACPPLPKITSYPATFAQKKQAETHFKCTMNPTGAPVTAAQLKAIWIASGKWITEQERIVYGPPRERRDKPGVFMRPGPPDVIEKKATETLVRTLAEQPLPRPTPSIIPPPAGGSAAPANVTPENLTMTGRTGLGSLVGAGVGSVIPGVGTTIGGVLGGVLGSLGGQSKCPGPYNYNPRTGGCDPKPGYGGGTQGLGLGLTSGGPCPTGWTWDGMQCKKGGLEGFVERTLPGGETGVMAAGQWTTTDTPLGAGYIPLQRSQTVLVCPEGYVLVGNRSGKNPGLEVCMPKGHRGVRAARKWPAPAKPVMSAQDRKTLAKAKRLQNKAKRVAMNAGFTCKKR